MHTWVQARTHSSLAAPSLALPDALFPPLLQCLLKLDKNAGLARCEGAVGGNDSRQGAGGEGGGGEIERERERER